MTNQIHKETKAKAIPVFAYRCPECHAPLTQDGEQLACASGHRFGQQDGIWLLLSMAGRQQQARFLQAYTKVREAEGWARPEPDSDLDANAAYYLALPDYDLSGLYNATWKMRGRNYRAMVAHLDSRYPAPLCILDLGAGNGWMSRRLAEAGHAVCAVDINMHPADGLPVARVYFNRQATRFARAEGEMANLPLQDGQFDAVIANASLHYTTALDAALREAARVLRPGGVLITLDSPFFSDLAAGEQMVAARREAYRRYHQPTDAAGSFLSYQRFAEASTAAGLGRIDWRGQWRKGAVSVGAWWGGLMQRLRRRGEPPTFPIVFAYKDGDG